MRNRAPLLILARLDPSVTVCLLAHRRLQQALHQNVAQSVVLRPLCQLQAVQQQRSANDPTRCSRRHHRQSDPKPLSLPLNLFIRMHRSISIFLMMIRRRAAAAVDLLVVQQLACAYCKLERECLDFTRISLPREPLSISCCD
jgi:hypothetical protein